ncbi:MAG: hypothetical protein MZV63_25975 [Marinilabiliales bacterium]|nr:hypothetical protein [Marinilabiliales bacterium]
MREKEVSYEESRHSGNGALSCGLRELRRTNIRPTCIGGQGTHAGGPPGGPEDRQGGPGGAVRPQGIRIRGGLPSRAVMGGIVQRICRHRPRGLRRRPGLGPAVGGYPAQYRPNGEGNSRGSMAARLPFLRPRLQPAGDHARGQRRNPRDRHHVRPAQKGRFRPRASGRGKTEKARALVKEILGARDASSGWPLFRRRRAAKPIGTPFPELSLAVDAVAEAARSGSELKTAFDRLAPLVERIYELAI